jgi:hypothetical protein
MAEYGQGVGQGTGLTGGGAGAGGGTMDVGQAAAGFVNDAVTTAIVVAILLGFIVLKKAF